MILLLNFIYRFFLSVVDFITIRVWFKKNLKVGLFLCL